MVVADLENDLLAEIAVCVGEEIGKLRRVAVKAGIHAGRENERRVQRALGETAQCCRGVAIDCRELLAVAVVVAVSLGHDVDVDAARYRLLPQMILATRSLLGIGGREHLLILPGERTVGEQLEVARDITLRLEGDSLQ